MVFRPTVKVIVCRHTLPLRTEEKASLLFNYIRSFMNRKKIGHMCLKTSETSHDEKKLANQKKKNKKKNGNAKH